MKKRKTTKSIKRKKMSSKGSKAGSNATGEEPDVAGAAASVTVPTATTSTSNNLSKLNDNLGVSNTNQRSEDEGDDADPYAEQSRLLQERLTNMANELVRLLERLKALCENSESKRSSVRHILHKVEEVVGDTRNVNIEAWIYMTPEQAQKAKEAFWRMEEDVDKQVELADDLLELHADRSAARRLVHHWRPARIRKQGRRDMNVNESSPRREGTGC